MAFDVAGGWSPVWNMVVGVAEGGAGFNKEEHLENLKHSLDQRLRGNRAPLLISAHSQFYAAQPVGRVFKPPNITSQEMRQVLRSFSPTRCHNPKFASSPTGISWLGVNISRRSTIL